MDIIKFLGPSSAEAAQTYPLPALQASYRELLEMDGIVFPHADLKKAELQWDAHAARQRGEYLLDEAGTVVDLSDFDEGRALTLFRANRKAMQNSERLTSLAELGLYSKAGSLAAAGAATTEQEPHEASAPLHALTQQYKHFVQAGIAVERWERPWAELVSQGFDGEALEFPLSPEEVTYAGAMLFASFFAPLRKKHFSQVPAIQLAMINSIESSIPYTSDSRPQPNGSSPQRVVAMVGLFCHSSPEGCNEVIDIFQEQGHLTRGIDWHGAVRAAVKDVEDHFFKAP